MATENWVDIGSGNGLLPAGTKPLPEPTLTYHEFDALASSREQFHRNFSKYQFNKWVPKLWFQNCYRLPRGQWVNTLRPNQTLLARCRRHHLAIRSPICILIQTNLNLTDNRTPFQYKDHFSWYGCLLFKQAANHCPQRTTKIMPL